MGNHNAEQDTAEVELSPQMMQAMAAAALIFACNEELRHSKNDQVNQHLTSIKKRARDLIEDCGISVTEIRTTAFELLTRVYQDSYTQPNGQVTT